jgi:type VI protein secretion system component Hcp
MAADAASDLMMKFVHNTKPIAGESTAKLISSEGSSNPLLTGFKPGFMFEVDRFTFRAGIVDDEPGTTGPQGNTTAPGNNKNAKPTKGRPAIGGFQSFRAGKAHKYPGDVQPISFTRSIDASSPILIQNCINKISYDSATLIKRKAAGGPAAGEVFLRMDFLGVLVINVDWSNDDEVEETCQFICRSVTISYRPQLPSGLLGATVPGFWSMVAGDTQAPLA